MGPPARGTLTGDAGSLDGAEFRGGSWNNNDENLRVSNRNNAANTNANRNNNNGWRGALGAVRGQGTVGGRLMPGAQASARGVGLGCRRAAASGGRVGRGGMRS